MRGLRTFCQYTAGVTRIRSSTAQAMASSSVRTSTAANRASVKPSIQCSNV